MRPFFMIRLLVSALIVILCVLGYVQPFHSTPWPSAMNDALFLILGLIVVTEWVLSNRNNGIWLSRVDVFVILMLCVHIVYFEFFSDGKSSLPYIVFAGVSYLCFKVCREHVRIALIFGVFVAAVITAIFGLGQWLGVWQQFDSYQVWMVSAEPGTRLKGNVSQPNNAASLLIWGVISAVILSSQVKRCLSESVVGNLSQGLITSVVILMTLASAATLSRTATLGFFCIILVVFVWRRYLTRHEFVLISFAFFLHLISLMLIPSISTWLFDEPLVGMYGGKGFSDSARINAGKVFYLAIVENPWFGYGVGGVTSAFVENSTVLQSFGMYFANTHNLYIDFLVWFGFPFGLYLIYKSVKLLFYAWGRIDSSDRVLKFCLVLVVVIHSMLEYPLHYAYFLIPFVIIASEFYIEKSGFLYLSRAGVLVGIIFFAGSFIVLSLDYLTAEKSIRQARVELSITGRSKLDGGSRIYVIKELRDVDAMIRTGVVVGMTAEQLELFDRATMQYPMKSLIVKSITAFDLNEKFDRSAYWRERYRSIYGDITRIEGSRAQSSIASPG